MGQVPVFGGTKEEVFDWLRDSQLTIFGTSSKKDDSIYEVNFDRGSAFVLGSEKRGWVPSGIKNFKVVHNSNAWKSQLSQSQCMLGLLCYPNIIGQGNEVKAF